MDKKVGDILEYVLSAAVAVVLLYFSFRGVDWQDFLACLRECDWAWVAVAMVAGALVQLVRGLRWKMLIDPVDRSVPWTACFNAVNICMITNLVLPRAGELVRCGYITKNSRRGEDGRRLASYDKVFGTVIVERAWDAVMMMVLLCVLLSLMWHKYGAFFRDSIFGPLSQRAGTLWLVAAAVVALAACVWAVFRFRDRSRFCGRVYGVFQGIFTGLKTCLHMERGWLFVAYTVLIWLLYWLMSASILWAVDGIDPAAVSPDLSASLARLHDLTLVDALFLMFAGALSSVVPVPGGFGAFHPIVAGALSSVYGIPFGLGLIFATLSHESQTVMEIVLGLASFLHESVKQ